MKNLFFALAFVAPILFSGMSASAVQVTYSGGNGTPLSITLASPAEYTVNTAETAGTGLVFVFATPGASTLTATGSVVAGNITFTLDGSAGTALTRLGGNSATGGDVLSTYTYLLAPTRPALAVGDTLILSAGTMTTNGNFAGAPPASGNYSSFVAITSGARISTFATAVPEPGTVALTLLASSGAAVMAFRRRRK